MTKQLDGLQEIAESFDTYILDAWGVLHNGREPFAGVKQTLAHLREMGKTTIVVSNAPRLIEDMVTRLAEIGLTRDMYDHVQTSGSDTFAAFQSGVYDHFGLRCLFMGQTVHERLLAARAFARVSTVDEAEFILNAGPNAELGMALEDYEEILQQAAVKQLPMVCANPDLRVHVGGEEVLCGGAIARRYQELGGQVVFHGKPWPGVYNSLNEWIGATPKERIVAIGDTLRTDILGGNQFGVTTVFTKCGVHAQDFAEQGDGVLAKLCEEFSIWPDYVMDELKW